MFESFTKKIFFNVNVCVVFSSLHKNVFFDWADF